MKLKLLFVVSVIVLAGCALVLPPSESMDTGVISVSVWLDSNANGLRDADESGVPNVRIQLLDDRQNILINKGSNSGGEVRFELLDLGDEYHVRVLLPGEFDFAERGGDSEVYTEGSIAGLSELLSWGDEEIVELRAGLVQQN